MGMWPGLWGPGPYIFPQLPDPSPHHVRLLSSSRREESVQQVAPSPESSILPRTDHQEEALESATVGRRVFVPSNLGFLFVLSRQGHFV